MNAAPDTAKPQVAICSIVRDGMAYLPAYRRQLESLDLACGLGWRLYIIEGDSRDDTHAFLQRWAREDVRVTIEREHAGDSAQVQVRAARWARVANTCLDLVPRSSAHTHVLWLEADLCFPPELLRRLLAHEVDVVAPMIFLGGLFYDTWGFRDTAGVSWRNAPPFHPQYRPMSLIEMSSVGSCVLFRRAVLDAGVRMKGRYDDGLLVGMCHDARALGHKVYADTGTAILHPVDRWEEQMWQPSALRLIDRRGREETLRPDDARAMGLEMNLPLLDPLALLRAQTSLWRHLFVRLDTDRMAIDATARATPAKRYELVVRAHEPRGPLRVDVVRRALHRLLLKHRTWGPEPARSFSPLTQVLQRVFRCSMTLSIQAQP
jgi:hypothetical protein